MDVNRIIDICSISNEWKDIPITFTNNKGKEASYIIPLIMTGMNGIYVFIEDKNMEKTVFDALKKKFCLYDGLFVFVNEDEDIFGLLYNDKKNGFLEIEDFEYGLENFYYNHLIPQSELPFYNLCYLKDYLQELEIPEELQGLDDDDKYIRPVISDERLEKIEEIIDGMEDDGVIDGDYITYPDGTMKIRKQVSTNSLTVSSFGSASYVYPCEDEDGDKSFFIMLFGGWFGLHKFRHHKFWQGLLYLLTCGMCGTFYVFDLFSCLTGNYYDTNVEYKRDEVTRRIEKKTNRVYSRAVSKNKRKKLFFTLPVAFICALIISHFIYANVYSGIASWMGDASQRVSENYITENVDMEQYNQFE